MLIHARLHAAKFSLLTYPKYIFKKYPYLWPVIFLLLPFFLFLPKILDWNIYVYYVGYFSHSLTAGQLPEFVQNNAIFGSIQPLLYGILIYPILGILAIATGADMAFRLAVLIITLLPAALSYHLGLSLTKHRFTAFAFCSLITITQYAFTNLYFRGAAMEYVACGLLVTTVLLLCQAWLPENQQQQMRWYNWAALCWTLAAGSHPITLVLSFYFFIISLPVLLIFIKINRLRILGFIGKILPFLIPTFLSLLSFIYISGLLKNGMSVGGSANLNHLTIDFYRNIDEMIFKILPLAGDFRTYTGGLMQVQIPFLKAAIEMLQFAFAAWLLIRIFKTPGAHYKILTIIGFAYLILWAFGLVFLLSQQSLYTQLPAILAVAQFAYRFTTYINLFFTLAIILMFFVIGHNHIKLNSRGYLLPLLALIILCYTQLYMRFTELFFTDYYNHQFGHELKFEFSDQKWEALPYSYKDFADTNLYLPMPTSTVPILTSPPLPLLSPGVNQIEAEYDCPYTVCWIATRALPSRFLHITVDGQPPPADSVFLNTMSFVMLKVPTGPHAIQLQTILTPDIKFMRVFSYTIWFGWLGLSIMVWFGQKFSRKSAVNPA